MKLFSWGSNAFGQLGLERLEVDLEEEEYLFPVKGVSFNESNANIDTVACGWNHTVFLTDDGLVFSCGLNSCGQLGYERESNVNSPEQIKSLEAQKILQVSCGEDFTVVMNNAGQVFSFGSNEHGQLGSGSKDKSHAIPRQIKGISHGILIASVCCGKSHVIALSTGGHVFCWGSNSDGQLGIGSTESEIRCATHMKALAGYAVVQVAAGGHHTFALTISGLVFAWGNNRYGQLGLGHTQSCSFPVEVKSLSTMSQKVKFIVCGEEHSAVLTQAGALLTFGCGKSGQLGHGCFSDEMNPKAVNPLIGTVITQVACGRKHTLCYSSRTGEMFAFGLNVKGQLGINTYQKQDIPVKLSTMWLSISDDLSSYLLQSSKRYENIYFKRRKVDNILEHEICLQKDYADRDFLHQIFSGGLQSFFTTFVLKNPVIPVNKLLAGSDSLLYLTQDTCEDLINKTLDYNEQQRLLLLRTVFSNPSCLNASFLDSENCGNIEELSSHGVRLMAVHQSCCLLFGHSSYADIITQSLKNSLLPALNNLQSNAECLRVYIIIPEILNCYNEPDKWEMVQLFSQTILHLDVVAQSTLNSWWSKFPVTFFERLLQCFKTGLVSLLELMMEENVNSTNLNEALDRCLKMMGKLFEVNEEADDILVHTAFYVPQISEYVDIKNHFVQWIKYPERFSYFKFPFVFETKRKSLIMELHAELQMKIMINSTHMQNLTGFVNGNLDVPSNPFLVFDIRRDCIVQDTLNQILAQNLNDLKKPLRIKFRNEDGEDAGGVRKEFFLLLMKEILDPRFGMFDFFKESGLMWFKAGSFESPDMFLLIGVICGLAIYNSVIIDLPFPITLFRKLLNKKTGLNDLIEIQPDVGRSLQYMLDYTGDDFEGTFNLHFQMTEQLFGELKTIDLKENGSNIAVTEENRDEYVEVYVNYKMCESVQQEFSAFSDGFHRVCGSSVLRFFHPQELMDLVVGCSEYDFSELEKIVEYKGEFHRNHSVINFFWDTFYTFNIDLKKKFLAFLTGTNKVSIHGINHMKFIIQPMFAESSINDHLPVAHTCFNILDLPMYSSFEIMKEKLCQAIEYSEGFGLV